MIVSLISSLWLSTFYNVLKKKRWNICQFSTHCTWGQIHHHGPLTRYVKLRVAHAPGRPGTFSPPPTSRKPLVSDTGMHQGTCVTHVPWCILGSLTSGGGKIVPGIPGACTAHNFTYLARDPLLWDTNNRLDSHTLWRLWTQCRRGSPRHIPWRNWGTNHRPGMGYSRS